jgi:hypothetical protein
VNNTQGEVGTSGNSNDTFGARDDGATPGGTDPAPRPDRTSEELSYRGVDNSRQGQGPALTSGGHVDLSNVPVVNSRDDMFWIQDGAARVAVMTPERGSVVRTGSKVDITGVAESDGQGGLRIRASHVEIHP